jgi:predicted nuclease with TOPRIM domain
MKAMWIQQPKADAVSETDALRAQLDEAKAKADELKTKLSEQEAKTRDMQERCVRLPPGLP